MFIKHAWHQIGRPFTVILKGPLTPVPSLLMLLLVLSMLLLVVVLAVVVGVVVVVLMLVVLVLVLVFVESLVLLVSRMASLSSC
jgi:hypothetical protein